MMSIDYIRQLSVDATTRARQSRRQPAAFKAEQIEELKVRGLVVDRIPFLGDYVPEGWKRTKDEELFVDLTGIGHEDEPALTQRQLARALDPNKAYGFITVGQFQGYVVSFERKKTGTKRQQNGWTA